MNNQLTLNQQIGQMLFCGFEGTRLLPSTEKLIREGYVGGLILFERNFESPQQLWELMCEVQDCALSVPPHLPLLISVDQEGGRVARLGSPFTRYPFPCAIGKSQSESLAYRFGQALARELRAVGINMDFAPVLDVHTNPANPIIGNRAFSDQPSEVARLGYSFIKAFREEQILAVGKHFPGHGDTHLDSHLDLPRVDRDSESLENLELFPFVETIRQGLDIIMTSHVIYSAWDEKFPATLSPKILQDILRKRLGFQGLILSDDMDMKAIEDYYEFESLPSLGVNAGVDMFLFCHAFEKIERFAKQLEQDVRTGAVSEKAVQEVSNRVLEKRKALPSVPEVPPDFESFRESHQKLADEMAGYLG